MEKQYSFTNANEKELNDLVAGKSSGLSIRWPFSYGGTPRVNAGSFGVLNREAESHYEATQPLALIVPPEDSRRLYARFSQLRSDLSPLSSWCHLISANRFASMDGPVREANLNGYEAAWTGIIIAESLLLARRPISQIKLSACQATQSYAIARMTALWDRPQFLEIFEQYDTLQQLVKTGEGGAIRLRSALQPIWTCLTALSASDTPVIGSELRSVIAAIRALRDARLNQEKDESLSIYRALISDLPEAELLQKLSRATPEIRLKEFDGLIRAIAEASNQKSRRFNLSFLAGYLVTIAAGGSPSLSLAEQISGTFPEITAWAYMIGGIGEKVTWTSSFDGLGRLVARELARPFRLDEPPTCDFALEEGATLVDKQLSDPLVHLKIKQQRVALASIAPGVNIAISLVEQPTQDGKRATISQDALAPSNTRSGQDILALLADALVPYLTARMPDRPSPPRTSGTNFYNNKKAPRAKAGKRETSDPKLLPDD